MSNFGDVLQEYFVDKYRKNNKLRAEKLRNITTREQAEKYVAQLRQKVKRTFKFPAEKCPLNPRIAAVHKYNGFSVENIIIDSRPGFPVTMNLYLPEKREGKIPATLVLCGHSSDGKGCNNYYYAAQTVARNGGAALVIDPIHQGERLQYSKEEDPGLCNLHNRFNSKQKAYGDNFGNWRVYDAVRALDYLLTRPEIDADRIGVTGNSGGGTLTTLVNAVEDRFAAAAPSCYITRWVRNVENELPVDAEQIPPGFAADGGEMADLLLAAAPRPILILGQMDDFFDVRGTREVFQEVRRIYELLGHGDRAEIFVGPCGHGLSIHNRNAIYGFYAKHLGTAPAEENESTEIPREELFCFPNGQVQGKTISEFIAEEARQAAANRPRLSDDELKTALAGLLEIGETKLPFYRQLRPKKSGELMFNRYGIESEKGILVTLKQVDTAQHFHLQKSKSAELYLPHQDAGEELAGRTVPENTLLYGLDYRGVGECMPNGCDQWNSLNFFSEYHFDYHFDSLEWLMGKSYLGGRVRDVLSAIELLWQNGTTDITLTASGIGMVPAIFAAFLSRRPVKLALDEKVPTYLEHCCERKFVLPQSMVPAGILHITDLDDLVNRLVK